MTHLCPERVADVDAAGRAQLRGVGQLDEPLASEPIDAHQPTDGQAIGSAAGDNLTPAINETPYCERA